MNGELVRKFLRHKVYGDVYGVELVLPSGEIVAALKVDPTTMCKHELETAVLGLDDVAAIAGHRDDFQTLDLPCRDASHWLHDMGEQHLECVRAREEYDQAHQRAKQLKEALEEKETRLRAMVREAVEPMPMPLFDKPAA